ncbi:MAG: isochorismatase [Conexibacter sp.]|nr:isochorismatase [Conexibacter sp.]
MADTALIVIDMLNPYDHEDADALAAGVEAIIEPLSRLIAGVREDDDVELIYVNDNYGDFGATREDLVRRAREGRRPDLIEPIAPPADCPFLPKVRHSAFYSTSLEYLLRRDGIETVILTGQVTEQCVLYSALDAYVRHFAIRVPRDAVAPIDPRLGDAALEMMERNMRADLLDAASRS